MQKKMALMMFFSSFITTSSFANTKFLETGLHHNLGLEGYYHTYRETVDGNNFFMQLKGPMLGVYYKLAVQPENTLFRFAVDSRFGYGFMNYKSSRTGSSKHETQSVLECRLLGSYTMVFKNQWMLEDYVGLGIRYLVNPPNNRPTTNGYYSYLRKSRYYYVPIGVRLINELSNEMRWDCYLEYDWFLSGLQTSSYNTMPQPHGRGARIGADFHIPCDARDSTYTIGVFARYWKIWDSRTSSNGYYEPKNVTKEIGMRVGMIF